MAMEPDWSNVDAIRSWLDSRYPNSNNQTHSPLYRYLKDELAGTHQLHRLEGRETHLSTGEGGEFLKFVFENAGGNTLYYRKMRKTIYPVKDYPQFKIPPPPDSDDSSESESSEKRGGAETTQLKRKRSSKTPESAPNKAKIQRRNSPTKDTTTDEELARIQDERRSTLRPRRNGEVHKEV